MQYRVQLVDDGGGRIFIKRHLTLLAALRTIRDLVTTDPRVGATHGVLLTFRLCTNAPWHAVSSRDTDRYAADYRIKNWTPLFEGKAKG